VEVEWRPGSALLLSVLAVPDPTYVVYGPKRHGRAAGSPAVVAERFRPPADAAGPFTLPLEGENELRVEATDAAGNRSEAVRRVVRDTEAPTLVVSEPAEGAETRAERITVAGTVQDRSAVTVRVGGVRVQALRPPSRGEHPRRHRGGGDPHRRTTDQTGPRLLRRANRDLPGVQRDGLRRHGCEVHEHSARVGPFHRAYTR
jgi:hypothetical protein